MRDLSCFNVLGDSISIIESVLQTVGMCTGI